MLPSWRQTQNADNVGMELDYLHLARQQSTVTKRHESGILNKIFAQYKLSSFLGNDFLMTDL